MVQFLPRPRRNALRCQQLAAMAVLADENQTMIDWVENSMQPTRLKATVSSGKYAEETKMLCQWLTRPLWSSNDSLTFNCMMDEASAAS